MVRGSKFGNGTQSPVYYPGSAGLGPPRPRPPALGETDPPASDRWPLNPICGPTRAGAGQAADGCFGRFEC